MNTEIVLNGKTQNGGLSLGQSLPPTFKVSPGGKGSQVFLRKGRAFFWPRPHLYRWFGMLRGRGDCLANNFDVWIDGFPRSSNTFAVELFRMANPGARLLSHRHIPTFIVSALGAGKPGIFLLRKPEDAAVSWAIFWQTDIEPCLDYYIDYHRVLKPYAAEIFVAPFERVTAAFPEVIGAFNRRFGLNYASMPNDPATIADCVAKIEECARTSDGGVDEYRVCRPSIQRGPARVALLERVRTSSVLKRKLALANELYSQFTPSARVLPQIAPLPHVNGQAKLGPKAA